MKRVRTTFTGVQGSPWLSTMYFEQAAGTPQQAATAVGVFWTAIQARMATNVLWSTDPVVLEISEVTGKPLSSTTTTPSSGAGTGSATELPIVTQGLIRWGTGIYLAGREVRGRTFVPGLTENDNDLGVPNAGVAAIINGACTTLLGNANADLVVWSRKNGVRYAAASGSMAPYWSFLKTRRD